MVLRYKLMSNTAYQDEVIILKVKDWQTADKYAVCFSRAYGKIPFLAYGARYARTTGGRLIQPFAMLDMQLYSGKRLDSMKSCELIALPQQMDIKQMAYASVIAEVTEALTEAHEPQEDIYELLVGAVQILSRNNPRLVALSAICKLLVLTGFAPVYDACVNCTDAVEGDAFFSVVQGGLICEACHGGEELPFSSGAQKLLQELIALDFKDPQPFTVRGGDLMQLEQILYRFIVYQIDKPLKSLSFLAQLGL